MPRPIELLSPARNLQCGIEAVRHGADAVYIGAPRFGARAAAGNSVEDIAELVRFAHPFGVRIYVTLNTLLYDDELPEALTLIDELAAIHVDALIVQDERINGHSPIPLHSSTQMDNRTIADVRARAAAGYQQTVLARELSLDDIRTIHEAVPEMPLEAFVHGALCVSYSGRCYASEYCFQRSANRGECAQFCRLPFDLVDAEGHVVRDPHSGQPLRGRHLLSLRDMNRADDLEALMDAGISSFKIEGRLKDVGYVKNLTAYYRQHIDAILAQRADFCRASYGTTTLSFKPSPLKSFNRGFTDYFLHGRTEKPISQPLTPKSLGEPVGTVKDVRPGDSLAVAGAASFANGDGLCFFTSDGHLVGFRVNRVDLQGRLYPADTAVLGDLHKGTRLFRNYDADFERILSRPTAERHMAVRWRLEENADATGFRLTLTAEHGRVVAHDFVHPYEVARTPQADNLRRLLMRLGDTPFAASEADIELCLSDNWFIPASTFTGWRRQLTDEMASIHPSSPTPDLTRPQQRSSASAAQDGLTFSQPINPIATRQGGESWPNDASLTTGGLSSSTPAPQTEQNHDGARLSDGLPTSAGRKGEGLPTSLMTCRHCTRHDLGQCPRQARTDKSALREPLSLRLADGRQFPLHFDCKQCEMHVLAPKR